MTELILAAWILSAVLVFLPVGRAARLIGRRLRPAVRDASAAAPEPGPAPEGAVTRPLADPGSGGAAVATAPPQEAGAVPAAPAPRPPAARALRLLGGPATLVLYLVFIAGAIYLGPRLLARLLDTDHPMAAITSQSMYPSLKRGDIVLLQGVDMVTDLEVGDIIAFQSENTTGLVIHRIIAIDGEGILTQGDANFSEDPAIAFDDVIGRAVRLGGRLAKLPYLGNIPLLFGGTSETDDGLAEPPPVGAESEEGELPAGIEGGRGLP